ncbi:DUF4350 domain-containing protein [Cellulomonas aerilata]|uniref:DUF4350 domain-containing protein n=1 Tax=Cellulomonas aerilata TaxID=515326 RepID=UPI0011BDFCFE|nr:DUF4350 domain-containing protein [Cellulomonas aerilata]
MVASLAPGEPGQPGQPGQRGQPGPSGRPGPSGGSERTGLPDERAGTPSGTPAGAGRQDPRPSGRPGARRARWRWTAVGVGLALLVVLAALLPEPSRSTAPLAPDNPDDGGAQALARILERQGVQIEYVRRTNAAVAAADGGGTLLVTASTLLLPEQEEALAGTDNDLVLLDPGSSLLAGVTDAAEPATGSGTETDRVPACDDPDAIAAGSLRTGSAGYRALTDDATTCFPGDDPGAGALLVVEGDRRVTALAEPSVLTNARLAEDGNAALALRLLGAQDRVVWYVPSFDDLGTTEAPGPALGDLLPPWAGPVALQALVVAVVAALWRGRRLGRLVTEPLPVTVQAAEATRGRGRLYRRSRAYGHAAASLRAGTASRTAARLGLPRSAGAVAVIDALAQAAGRPADDVAALLYGPPPTDDAGLTELARRLDDLESEVHRP